MLSVPRICAMTPITEEDEGEGESIGFVTKVGSGNDAPLARVDTFDFQTVAAPQLLPNPPSDSFLGLAGAPAKRIDTMDFGVASGGGALAADQGSLSASPSFAVNVLDTPRAALANSNPGTSGLVPTMSVSSRNTRPPPAAEVPEDHPTAGVIDFPQTLMGSIPITQISSGSTQRATPGAAYWPGGSRGSSSFLAAADPTATAVPISTSSSLGSLPLNLQSPPASSLAVLPTTSAASLRLPFAGVSSGSHAGPHSAREAIICTTNDTSR